MQPPLQRLYLLYHELRPSGSRYSYVLSTEEFERHIDLFAQLRQPDSGTLWPEVTFDDGHISNFEYAFPTLETRNLKASFFITVGWTNHRPGYMGWSELQALHNAGHRIGAHGWTHTLLTHCNEKDLLTELNTARLTLEDKLGTSITTMSLPGGRSSPHVLAACKAAGYTQIYTSIPKSEPDPNAPTIGRLNIRGNMTLQSISNLLQSGNSALPSLERQYRIKSAAKSLLGDRIYARLWALLNRHEDTDMEEPAAHEDSAHHQ
jgi:peptidoglycan/xylan/chitin deacetylase (PgdA/CDA1 family)